MKRMLEAREEGGKIFVSCNSSSLEILKTCMKKAEYALKENFRKEEGENEAQQFGTAVHKSLEEYYSVANTERDEPFIAALCERFRSNTSSLGQSDGLRTGDTGERILRNYFETYRGDPWVIHSASGSPFVERDFEFELFDSDTLNVRWHGKIDAIFRHQETGELAVFDHKTTTTLGKEFLMRWNPNHQAVGYVLGARKAFDLDIKKFVANGIQVAKTKQDLLRVEVDVQDYRFEQFTDMVLWNVRQYLISLTHDLWPMAGGTTCSQWGGCQYAQACSMAPSLRMQMLKQTYAN